MLPNSENFTDAGIPFAWKRQPPETFITKGLIEYGLTYLLTEYNVPG